MDIRKENGERTGRGAGRILYMAGAMIKSLFESRTVKWIAAALFQSVGAALLARGIVLAQFAPLGVAFVAACTGVRGEKEQARTSKLLPFAALLGAVLGYSLPNGRVDGLKYAAATVLCFSAGIIFREAKFFSHKLFMPAAAAFSILSTNAIYVFAGGASAGAVLLFCAEVILCAAATYFYASATALMPLLGKESGQACAEEDAQEATLGSWGLSRTHAQDTTRSQRIGLLVWLGSLIVSLYAFTPVAGMSVGRIIALILVLTGASAGPFFGSAVGLCAGFALDMSAGSMPVFAACYGLVGLLSGAFRRLGIVIMSVVFIVGSAAALPWMYESASLAVLFESLAAVLLFLPFGKRAPRLLARVFPRAITGDELGAVRPADSAYLPGDGVRSYMRERLGEVSAAFRGMHAAVLPHAQAKEENDDPRIVFDAAVERTCRKCPMSEVCWNQEYTSTRCAINDATQTILTRGRAMAEDFAPYFSARCTRYSEFIANVNEAIAAHKYRRRYRMRVRDDVQLLCAQYDGMTRVLRDMADELESVPHVRRELEERLQNVLEEIEVHDAQVRAVAGRSGRLKIEIDTSVPEMLTEASEEVAGILSAAAGRALTGYACADAGSATRVSFWEREKLRAVIGVGVSQKRGEEASGDNGCYFKTGDGRLYVLISDGMGSGSRAAAESGSMVRLLENFLRAGLPPETALQLLCPAFAIRCEGESFTTVDLLSIDLYTGEGVFYKCGAPPSFVRENAQAGGAVRRVTSSALPAGLHVPGAMETDRTELTLRPGDTVVMVSDGIADATKDNWLVRLLGEYKESGSGDLAARILEIGTRREEGRDDMTVLVVKICENENMAVRDESA